MDTGSVDSSPPSPPPDPPSAPVDSSSSGADTSASSSSTSTDSTSSPSQASGSSGDAGAAAAATPSPEFTRSWTADTFGAANSDSTQAVGATSGASPQGGASLDRNADGFEAAKTASGPNLTGAPADTAAAGANPTAAAAGASPTAAAGANPTDAAAGAQPQQLASAQQPPPQPDPATRQRVEDAVTQRLNGAGDARDVTDRLARALGNGDMRRGMEALDRALQDGRLNLGLAGINGPRGGQRNQDTLEALRRDMNGATGGNLHSVLDNDNGALAANRGAPDDRQLAALREVHDLSRQLNLPVDLVSHSNGFNTLRTFLDQNPNAHFGNVTLINPNVPPNFQDTQRGFQAMVNQSDHTRLVTSIADGVVPLSGAGRNGNGSVWEQQINAAARAGVPDITVLNRAGHGVDSVADQINRPRPNLDFARDPATGQTVPRDPAAWRQLNYNWSPQNGFQRIPVHPFPHIGRAA
jgi:hypothetical protein